MLTRVESELAQTTSWAVSTDQKAVFLPAAIPMTSKLAKDRKLLVQLTPYGESPVMTTFDTTGAEAATSGIKDACGWQ